MIGAQQATRVGEAPEWVSRSGLTRQPIVTTWHNNFLWSAPSYFVGAGSAALAASLVAHAGYWIAPLTFAPLYLTYRTYKVYMGRVEDEDSLPAEHKPWADPGGHHPITGPASPRFFSARRLVPRLRPH